MNKEQINALLNSFFISQDDLAKRDVFKEFSNSLSDIIVDEFANNYLLNNPYLSIYLAHTDGNMLLKKIKTFVAFILTAPVDEEYIQRIQFIGALHYSIKLDPAKVSYGFWAINEILNKMSDVNEIVKENKSLISKLLKFVEHVMNDEYYLQKNSHNSREDSYSFNAQNELYIGFNLHKLNMKKIRHAVSSSDVEIFKDIEEKASACPFGKILSLLTKEKQYEYILGDSAAKIEKLHNSWHKEYLLIKNSIQNNQLPQTQQHLKNLENYTSGLKNILDHSLKESLDDGQLSLNSSIKAMRNMTNLFYVKNFDNEVTKNFEDSLKTKIKNTILSELNWAIEEMDVRNENSFSNDCTIIKQIRYKANNLFIGIKIKDGESSSYLMEMLNLLLEVLDLHLSVKERELSLINFADKAESANKSKDMFLANMSHELRTPLNAITGFSQILMMRKETPDSVKKYVEKINIAGNNLLELVNTILDFAKLEAGKMQFKPTLSNISDVLYEVNTLISPLAQKKNISLKMPNIVSLNLFIDKTLFKQVLINLLTNAVKFTQDGGDVSLNITYNADKHRYIFEVKDNGIGLTQESISSLFQPFSQINNSYQKEQKGTGLGLMICKKIVEELHNGKIWVESVEGEGSSFFLSMTTPMIESHTYHVHDVKDAPLVLVVEDSESYQKILIEHLHKTHNLTITDTVNKAKELIVNNDYDFIILDFFLTDGISSEVLQFMEEENIEIPTIVISAEDEIIISTSLAGSTNLECIINKKNIDQICASIKGQVYQ